MRFGSLNKGLLTILFLFSRHSKAIYLWIQPAHAAKHCHVKKKADLPRRSRICRRMVSVTCGLFRAICWCCVVFVYQCLFIWICFFFFFFLISPPFYMKEFLLQKALSYVTWSLFLISWHSQGRSKISHSSWRAQTRNDCGRVERVYCVASKIRILQTNEQVCRLVPEKITDYLLNIIFLSRTSKVMRI